MYGLRVRPHPCKYKRTRPSVITQAKCKVIGSKLPRGCNYTGFICLRLSENELLARLKNAGGYNPRYVAINRKEALKFVNLAKDTNSLLSANIIKPAKIETNWSGFWDLSSALHQQDEVTVADETERRQNRLPSGAGTVNQQCFDKCPYIDGSPFKRICTESSAITQLPANVFQPFINEVVCSGGGIYVSSFVASTQDFVSKKF